MTWRPPNLFRITSVAPPPGVALPQKWKRDPCAPLPAHGWKRNDGLYVLASIDEMDDGSSWLHASVSRKSRLPSWNDLCLVKALFIGSDREALQVLTSDVLHVNYHKYCLHLWSEE